MTACGKDDGADRIFRYDISGNPQTLDPQQANEPNSNVIIENMFMGLLAIERDGSVKEGAASDYIVSDDGLTYDFKLRQDVYWVDGDKFEKQCTAKDFVFGFTRLFLPETGSPRAQDFFCIKNSELFNQGKITDSSLLGVKAKGDFEFEITLEYPNARFLSMLAEPPAMPCNEEFFLNSQGKYGLSAECTPSNGAFYLKSWTYDPYSGTDINNLVLRRNYKNAETREIFPSGLNFFIEDEDKFVSDFLNGEISCLAVSNDDKAAVKGDYGCTEFSSITCGLVFNKNFGLFRSGDFRKALSMLADRESIIAAIPEFEAAEGIVPKQVSMLDKSYRELAGEIVPEYNVQKARELFQSVQPHLNKSLFTGARIIVPDTTAQTAVSYIMQEWQREFGFYCVVELLEGAEYSAALESGDFDIAAVELSGKYNSPSAYLEQFCKGNSGNYINHYSAEFEELLKRAEEANGLSESAELYGEAERMLIDTTAFLPLYFKNEYFFTIKKSADVLYNPFSKTVNFASAKMFK